MNEQSKAAQRRRVVMDSRFAERWFVGRGLDVGCGSDPLSKVDYPNIIEIVPYDIVLGNASGQLLPEIRDAEFDFVHSSHCLEHLVHPRIALANWVRVVKPGGYLICTVPEEFLYEQGHWPSRFNADHKHSFTLRSIPIIPGSGQSHRSEV